MCRFNKLTTLLEHVIHYRKKNKCSDCNMAEEKWFHIHVTQYFKDHVNFEISWGYFDCLTYLKGITSLTQHLHMAAALQPMGLPCLWKYSLCAGLKNSLKLPFHVFSYTQIQAKRLESLPFNLKGCSVLWNFYYQPHSPVHYSHPNSVSEHHLY